jgi:UDP-glucose 4-epimerase
MVTGHEEQAMTRPPRLLVIGGNGFIGQHTVRHAVQLGWEVTSVSLSAGHPPDGAAAIPVKFLQADICNVPTLKSALGGAAFEYVANCGGYADHTPFFKGGGRAVIDTHLNGVMNLVEVLDRSVLRSLVNLGSAEEYGNAAAPQTEEQRERSISPYSFGKVAATHFLQMLHRAEDFPATTLRVFLTYGPHQKPRFFLPQIIQACLKGGKFPASLGTQYRDFCFIDDVVRAIFMSFEHAASGGCVLNVASGNPVMVRDVVEKVRAIIGRGEPDFGAMPFRKNESMAFYADIAKAREILGWEPLVSFDTGLKKTIDWVVKNNG